ncbi:MAG: PH domain-containing protein [Verrucomicrobiota bacterium]
MNALEDAPLETSGWQRLSPVSVAYFIIKFAVSFVKATIQNILPAIAVFSVFAENKLLWFSIAIPTIIISITSYAFLYYCYFKFKVREGEILIHRGVFKKEHLNLEFGRIQNVNIIRPLYFAPFKVVNCLIESAGSKGAEIELPGVAEAFANDTRSKVFAAEKHIEIEETQTDAPEPASIPEKLSNWEVAKSGLTSYFAFVALAAMAPFSDRIGRYLFENLFSDLLDSLQSVVGFRVVAGMILLIGIVFLSLFLLISGSMLGALARYYNYELHDKGDRLVRLTGFFERKSTTLKKSKVQSVSISQNLAARMLGRVKLQYRQIGVSHAKRNDASVHIPILRPDQGPSFTSIVFPDCPEPTFDEISPSYIRRTFVFFWLIPISITISTLSIFISKLFLLGFIFLVPGILILMLRYHRYGFWHNDEYGAIRQGFIGKRVTIFPLHKLQIANIQQSRGQRIKNLGNLTIQLGSGVVSIPYLPMEKLSRFVNLALHKTESSLKPWM